MKFCLNFFLENKVELNLFSWSPAYGETYSGKNSILNDGSRFFL